MHLSKAIYIFLDESGNFDFSSNGTKYFTVTSVTTTRPFRFEHPLLDCRYDLLEQGLDIEYFHAADDRQKVRDRVFEQIRLVKADLRVDSVIVEKCKVAPLVRHDSRFYPEMIGYLLRWVYDKISSSPDQEVIVITDRIPVERKRYAVTKAVKTTLVRMLPQKARYQICHHDSKSCVGLQVADYCSWAIYRAWDRNDQRSLDLIRESVASQFDIFASGTKKWY